ncbi:hypothetical protein VKT23_008770 [Stygiomarasmius scandens]|uniref:SET domain-containing protein n=1 Tax=Marasmiellus scandens TaxID=2682957 RepID=A0ABR1JKT7_9AGAR
MKRGFLNKPNALSKASTEYSSNTVKSQIPAVINLADQSKEVGGLKKGRVDVGDFKAQGYEIKPNDGKKLDYPDDAWITSTQPTQKLGATLADDPDGWAECFISGRAKRAIVSVPGFPEALPRPDPSRPKPYKIVETPGKGMGMFATRDIEWGELIIAERPLLVIPSAIRYMGALAFPANFTRDQLQQAQLDQMEKLIEMLVNRMPKENQEAYKKLANCHQEDGSGPLFGISMTNSFALGDYYEPEIPGYPEVATRYSGTCNEISRVNHSCRPNTQGDWDSPTFSFQLRASKPIKKGEEITLTYISDRVVEPTSERQRQLASYGFTCTCEACSNPEISDPRSNALKELLKPTFNLMMMDWINPTTGKGIGAPATSSGTIMPGMMSMGMANQLGQNTIEPALKGLKLLEEEGLYGSMEYGDLLGRVMLGYNVIALSSKEKRWEAKQWNDKYKRYKELFKSARNAKRRKEKECEEVVKKNEKEDFNKLVDEMKKKMNLRA